MEGILKRGGAENAEGWRIVWFTVGIGLPVLICSRLAYARGVFVIVATFSSNTEVAVGHGLRLQLLSSGTENRRAGDGSRFDS